MKHSGSDKIRIALLGYGSIGRVHSLCYRQIPFLYPGAIPKPVLHTVYTSRTETAEAAREEASFLNSTIDIESIIANPEVDVIDITLPNMLHRSVIEQAVRSGKFIYCEKPLAGTVADARASADAVRTGDSELGMVFQYRFVPAIIRAHQLISEDRIGRIFSFRAAYLHSGYQNPQRPLSWRLKKSEGGSGALGDLGSHVIDLVRYLLGEFESVQGHLETYIAERPVSSGSHETAPVTVDDAAWIRARMRDGAVGTIEVSRFATGTLDDLRIEIYGEKGALRFSLMDPNYLDFFDESNPGGAYGGDRGWKRIETVGFYPEARVPTGRAPLGWTRFHAENQFRFLQAVYSGGSFEPGIDDGLYAQFVLDAVERSHSAGGTWTTVFPATEEPV